MATVFVTVTATPVTKTVSVPFEVSPSIGNKYAVPPKLQAALDTSTGITATSTDYVTLIHVVTTAIPTISTPAVAEKGPYYYTAHNGTTVWLGGKTPPAGVPLSTSTAFVTIQPIPLSSGILSGGKPEPTIYSTVFLTLISKVYETETLTKTALAVKTSSAVTISSSVSVPSSNNTPSASPVQLVGTGSSVATASLIATTLSKSFTGLGLSGWNATFRTLLKENIVGTANEPAKLLSQQTGVKDNLVTRPGTASGLAAASGLAVPSRYSNATNNIGARQLGSIVVATIDGVVVSWTNVYDGAALKTQAPVAIASDAAPKDDLVVTCKFHHEIHDLLQILIPS